MYSSACHANNMGVQKKLFCLVRQWFLVRCLRNNRSQVSYSTVSSISDAPKIIDSRNMNSIIEKYDNILLDCDGVLWNVDHYTKFNGTAQSIEKLRKLGKNIFFVTNNSMHSRSSYKHKFQELCGFDADEGHIFVVSYVAALYLKNLLNPQEKCYVIGNKGMETELKNANIEAIGIGPDGDIPSDHAEDLLQHQIEENVAAVLVGFDHHFSYNKLLKATSYLYNPNCHYIVTSDKEVAITLGPKHRQPIMGPIVAAVSTASKRPPIVVGKPSKHLLTCVQQEIPKFHLNKTLMIGDSQQSDIQFAHNCGIDSALVLTGASTIQSVERAITNRQKQLIPNYLLSTFRDFHKFL